MSYKGSEADMLDPRSSRQKGVAGGNNPLVTTAKQVSHIEREMLTLQDSLFQLNHIVDELHLKLQPVLSESISESREKEVEIDELIVSPLATIIREKRQSLDVNTDVLRRLISRIEL